MNEEKFYDLYAYVIPDNTRLIKIPHISFDQATQLAKAWFNMYNIHDFMLVTENSTPWVEPAPEIIVKTPSEFIDFCSEKHDKLFL